MKTNEVHETVKSGYAEVAQKSGGCCGAPGANDEVAKKMGYSEADATGPAAVGNLGLGCGNPTALANLEAGETVIDLGSGAGFDALIAAPKLGPEGRFIGIDMTPDMLERARTNAVNAGFARTVEFREGLIEQLPVATETVDVVISNCVINLSPDKAQVFREAFRVLKPGGRLAVSDIVLSEPLPETLQEHAVAWVGCVGGALLEDEYLGYIRAAGFVDVKFEKSPAGGILEGCTADPMVAKSLEEMGADKFDEIRETVFSYAIEATRP